MEFSKSPGFELERWVESVGVVHFRDEFGGFLWSGGGEESEEVERVGIPKEWGQFEGRRDAEKIKGGSREGRGDASNELNETSQTQRTRRKEDATHSQQSPS